MPKVLPLNRTTRRHLKKLLHDQLDILFRSPRGDRTALDELLEAALQGQRLTVSVHVLDPETPNRG